MPDEREEGVGLGRAGHQLHPFVEQHDARTALASADRPVQQHGLPQCVRDVRGDAADHVGLGGAEAERAVLAVQAEVAPAVAADDQRGAQLVAEPGRSHDVAVARARAPRAAGGGVQRPDVPGRPHQLGERVDVVPAQLVVEEQRGHRDERVLAVGAGEQQGLGVGGREERGVDRHHSAQRAQDLPLQLGDVEAAAADAQYSARCRPRRPVSGRRCAAETPRCLGLFAAGARPTLVAMTTDQLTRNKHLVESFIQELFTKGDLTAVDRYLAPDFVNHDPPFPGAPDGSEGMRAGGGGVPPGVARLAQRHRSPRRRGRPRRRALPRLRHPHRRADGRTRRRQRRSHCAASTSSASRTTRSSNGGGAWTTSACRRSSAAPERPNGT